MEVFDIVYMFIVPVGAGWPFVWTWYSPATIDYISDRIIRQMSWDGGLHIDPYTSEPTSIFVLCYREGSKVKKRIVIVASESSGTSPAL